MTYDGSMPVDTIRIHPFPVPELFRLGSGTNRSITVTLAFDPPVRRQRRDYLGSSMQVDLYRNIDPDDLEAILREQSPENKRETIRSKRVRPSLLPGGDSTFSSTVQSRTWTTRASFVNDDETFLVAVTHRPRSWAKDDPSYATQSYALAVTLEDEALMIADLRQLLVEQVRLPARIRLRS